MVSPASLITLLPSLILSIVLAMAAPVPNNSPSPSHLLLRAAPVAPVAPVAPAIVAPVAPVAPVVNAPTPAGRQPEFFGVPPSLGYSDPSFSRLRNPHHTFWQTPQQQDLLLRRAANNNNLHLAQSPAHLPRQLMGRSYHVQGPSPAQEIVLEIELADTAGQVDVDVQVTIYPEVQVVEQEETEMDCENAVVEEVEEMREEMMEEVLEMVEEWLELQTDREVEGEDVEVYVAEEETVGEEVVFAL